MLCDPGEDIEGDVEIREKNRPPAAAALIEVVPAVQNNRHCW